MDDKINTFGAGETQDILSTGMDAERMSTGGLDSNQLRVEAENLFKDIIPAHKESLVRLKTGMAEALEEIEAMTHLSEVGKENERESIRNRFISEIEDLENDHLSWAQTELARLKELENHKIYEGDEEINAVIDLEKSIGEVTESESFTELTVFQKARLKLEMANNRLLRELTRNSRHNEWRSLIAVKPFDSLNAYRRAIKENRMELVQFIEENFTLHCTDENASKHFEMLKDTRLSEQNHKIGDISVRRRILSMYLEDYLLGQRLSRKAMMNAN